MSSPFSAPVLGLGALVSSPALYSALVEATLPLETAMIRFGVAALVIWVGLSLLEALLESTAPKATTGETTPRSLPGVNGPLPVRPAHLDGTADGH